MNTVRRNYFTSNWFSDEIPIKNDIYLKNVLKRTNILEKNYLLFFNLFSDGILFGWNIVRAKYIRTFHDPSHDRKRPRANLASSSGTNETGDWFRANCSPCTRNQNRLVSCDLFYSSYRPRWNSKQVSVRMSKWLIGFNRSGSRRVREFTPVKSTTCTWPLNANFVSDSDRISMSTMAGRRTAREPKSNAAQYNRCVRFF